MILEAAIYTYVVSSVRPTIRCEADFSIIGFTAVTV